MMISLLVLGTQAGLSLTLVLFIKAQGYDQFFQAAGVAASLAIGLAMGSLIKSNLASRLLGARVSLWRWSLLPAICAAGALGLLLQHLPEWAAMAFGIPLILAAYCACAWTLAFSESDRKLFR
jgi:hypothetical protein